MSVDFLAHIRSESARFAAALRTCGPDARVPSCPDWTATDLLAHLTKVQRFWGTIVRDRLDDPAAADAAEAAAPTDHAQLLDDLDATTAELADLLAAADDDVEVWTWSSDHTVGFIRRRQAHEVLIHRLDAELTAGHVTAFDPDLAVDGVDEALRVMYGGRPPWATWSADGPCGAITVDGGVTWRFRMGGLTGTHPASGTHYVDEPAIEVLDDADGTRPSFSIVGSARDVDAWLWNRPTVADLRFDGDQTDLATFVAAKEDGIQ